MKSVAFYTLGCKLNFSESSSIARLFESEGYKRVNFTERADVYVINTCSVTENADKKCRKVVKEARKHSPDAFVTIIGCFAQLKPTEISKIPGVDAVLGASEKFRLLEVLGDFERPDKPIVKATGIKEATAYNASYSLNDRTRTFLKVQDGCNYNCSFCTIPLARGKSRSDTINNIIKAAKEIAQTDVKEVVLTGVNIGDFGIIDGRRQERFADLIRELDDIDGIERFRISSIEPNLLDNEIIDFVAQSKKFAPHFHIPLQSGHDELLTAMRRRYLSELYTERVNHIKDRMPNACIGVDVIVGFPGETDEHFLHTYNYLNELDISYLHVFTYSERANTAAIELGEVVPLAKRQERSKMLRSLSEKKRRFFYEQQLEKEHEVLFEATEQNGLMEGFTENYVKITQEYDPLLVNEISKIKLKTINSDGNVTAIPVVILPSH